MSPTPGSGGTMTAPIWTTEPGLGLWPSTAMPAQSAVRTTMGDTGVPRPTGMKSGRRERDDVVSRRKPNNNTFNAVAELDTERRWGVARPRGLRGCQGDGDGNDGKVKRKSGSHSNLHSMKRLSHETHCAVAAAQNPGDPQIQTPRATNAQVPFEISVTSPATTKWRSPRAGRRC